MEQLNLFDEIFTTPLEKPSKLIKRVATTKKVADIRSEQQVTKKVAYDVGEKIGGARKDMAKKKADFEAAPSLEMLAEIEEEDISTAAALVHKNSFFSWFSLKWAFEEGFEAGAAKATQLLIQRIQAQPTDSSEERKCYTAACLFLTDLFRDMKTLDDFYLVRERIILVLSATSTELEDLEKRAAFYRESLQMGNSRSTDSYLEKQLAEMEKKIHCRQQYPMGMIRSLGPNFVAYFSNRKSQRSTNERIGTAQWEDMLKKKSIERTKSTPVWERELPDRPDRQGGRPIHIDKPESLVDQFGLRGSEFGHYVDDRKGREHVHRSAEAFQDLTDLLELNPSTLGFNGRLAMAFGSRGRGKALGHYEPHFKVINLTKEKGSLGILAHEWFHALDHYLFDLSNDFSNGKSGFFTKHPLGLGEPRLVSLAEQLQHALTHGSGVAHVDISKNTTSYVISSQIKSIYSMYDGCLETVMDVLMEQYDERVNGLTSYYRMDKERLATKRKKTIKKYAVVLSQHHLKVTGKNVTRIPISSDHSQFYVDAVVMDKGKEGKYWSSVEELAARAFEAFISDELRAKGWTSDYLVCGATGIAFPKGKEREELNNVFREIIKELKEAFLNKTFK